jgi:prepilin-type N-terminal cleavage/methylation domain-containing protein
VKNMLGAMRRRLGFTLIELLVVIAIIAILVALLLPAVQQVREAARKSQCQDHLHNIAVAIMDYEINHKTLPLNFDPLANGTQNGAAISWYYMVLPFFEQKPLYDSIDLRPWQNDPTAGNRGLTIVANNTAFQTPIDVVMCPSNPQAPRFSDQANDGAAPNYGNGNGRALLHARHDYSGNMGWVWTGWKDCGSATGGGNGAPWVDPNVDMRHRDVVRVGGAFWWRGASTVADFVDGLSNTILVFENHHWRDSGRFAAEINKPYSWSSPLGAVSSLHCPINDNPTGNDDTRCTVWSSTHPGGAQAVAGDAKVFFASENIDLGVMRGLATRSGSETVKVP